MDMTKKIGWALATSPSYEIKENAAEDGVRVDTKFWEDVNASIEAFESECHEIVGQWASCVSNEGHDSDDALCGQAIVTEAQAEAIREAFEFVSDGTYVITSSSGNFDHPALSKLHPCVGADLTLYDVPEDAGDMDDADDADDADEELPATKASEPSPFKIAEPVAFDIAQRQVANKIAWIEDKLNTFKTFFGIDGTDPIYDKGCRKYGDVGKELMGVPSDIARLATDIYAILAMGRDPE
jgi:hypothetical protein